MIYTCPCGSQICRTLKKKFVTNEENLRKSLYLMKLQEKSNQYFLGQENKQVQRTLFGIHMASDK